MELQNSLEEMNYFNCKGIIVYTRPAKVSTNRRNGRKSLSIKLYVRTTLSVVLI
jgi:hypothetical protein